MVWCCSCQNIYDETLIRLSMVFSGRIKEILYNFLYWSKGYRNKNCIGPLYSSLTWNVYHVLYMLLCIPIFMIYLRNVIFYFKKPFIYQVYLRGLKLRRDFLNLTEYPKPKPKIILYDSDLKSLQKSKTIK